MISSAERLLSPAVGRVARTLTAALLSALFWILLLPAARLEYVPGQVTAAVTAVVLVSAWRPDTGLLLLAFLVPIASWLGAAWPGSIAWPELIVVAFCAGYLSRLVVVPSAPADDLDLPVVATAAIVAASLAAELGALHARLGTSVFAADLWQIATRDYYIGKSGLPVLDAAMRLIEGLVLFRAAARAAQEVPGLGPRVTGWFVAGAAAAAAVNVLRVWEVAVRQVPEAPIGAFLRYLLELRVNVHHMDLNAAGSYFVLALFPAAGLAILSRRFAWVAPAALVGAGLWITGSRTALAAGVLTATATSAIGVVLYRRPSRRSFAVGGAAAVIAAAVIVAAIFLPARTDHAASSTALRIRGEFVHTSLRMWASRPVAGVGVGRYTTRAWEFTSDELTRIFPSAGVENAHNNFLQVLAELGLLGLVGLLWILGVAAVHSATLVAKEKRRPLALGVTAGLVAFVATWFGGHPLLIDAVAFPFWILLGTAAGWGRSLRDTAGRRMPRLRAATALLLFGVALSIPVRAQRMIDEANLDHVGIGVSQWQHGADGVRFRTAGAESTVFVPAVRVVTIPLRAVDATANLLVEVSFGNRPGNIVQVPGDRWHQLQLLVPATTTRRYLPLKIRVRGSTSNEPMLMIGRVEPR